MNTHPFSPRPLSSGKAPSAQLPREDHPLWSALSNGPSIRALRRGVMLLMPLLLAAAGAILINNFPLQIYQDFMTSLFGPGWKHPGEVLFNATIQIMALAVCFTLSDSFMARYNQEHPGQPIMPSIGMLTAFSCLFIMMTPQVTEQGLVLQWAGLRGLFGTFIVTFLACRVFLRLCNVKALRLRFYSEDADPLLPQIFDTLVPALCTLILFIGLRQSLDWIGIDSIHQALYDALRAPFHDAQNNFGLGALYTLMVQLSWFFGIHGPDLLDPLTHDIFAQGAAAANLVANSPEAPAHVLTKYLFDVYIYMGGSGATLGLLLAIFLRGKDSGSRRIAALSLVPGIFNINELVIFGLPIVFNPTFFIPFLFVPLLLLSTTYLAVASGLVPPPVFQVDWTTPPIINAFLATNSWRGVCLQLFNLGLSTAVYLPFVIMADKDKLRIRRKTFDSLVEIALGNTRGPAGKRCIDREDSAGALARSLANEMHTVLHNNDGRILLHYQPRVDLVKKTVLCMEGLVRWDHPDYGVIPAPLVLAIAEDTGQSGRLDACILRLAFEQQKKWRENNLFTSIAVNVSEGQLRDKTFPALLQSLFSSFNLPADAILLEVPESLALDPDARYLPMLQALHDTGAHLGVDDFGRGYRAISHLKRLPLSEVQIDRFLIRDIANNKSSQEVLGTIQELCSELGIHTSAEHVESEEQLEILLELNFSTFQGYFFSEPLVPEKCEEFIRSFGNG